ncbi:hypothetical protein ACNOYE_03830 [Nannocystaceae bacterium ST9]
MIRTKPTPVVRLDDAAAPEIDDLVERLQRLLIEHPVAAQSAIAALIAEGRRHARTPVGTQLLAEIRHSELARRARITWESSVLNVIDERDDDPLPTALIDAFFGVLMSDEPEGLLTRTNPLE